MTTANESLYQKEHTELVTEYNSDTITALRILHRLHQPSAPILEHVAQPVQALKQPFSLDCRGFED